MIEEARAKLKSAELTPVTAERFLAWKAEKIKKKQDAQAQAKLELEQRFAKGEKVLSGRALFAYNPDLFKDDEGADADKIVAKGAMEDEDDERGNAAADDDVAAESGDANEDDEDDEDDEDEDDDEDDDDDEDGEQEGGESALV